MPAQLLTKERSGSRTHSFLSPDLSSNLAETAAMTNDIIALIEYYEKEKGIDRDKIISALEFSFISAYRKMVPGADAIESLRAEVNTKKGETRIFAALTVVADEEYANKFN